MYQEPGEEDENKNLSPLYSSFPSSTTRVAERQQAEQKTQPLKLQSLRRTSHNFQEVKFLYYLHIVTQRSDKSNSPETSCKPFTEFLI